MHRVRVPNSHKPCFIKKKAGLLVGFFVFVVLLFSPYSASAMGEEIKGIYGVPSMAKLHPSSYVGELEKAGVNAVFIKPDRDTIKWFNARGFKVYVSIDAYGGSKAWKRYPDSRPVLADGSLLGTDPAFGCHGGACPTHEAWQRERIGYIRELLEQFSGNDGRIDGVWLDYIRYPGRWSVKEPQVPDTCYCPRCLRKFSKETGIALPPGLKTQEVSRWIKRECAYEWMKWKKEQISRFVADVKKIIDESSGDSQPVLGVFLVPWTKGERQNGVSYKFAQDSFQLSKSADVISPMVYHKMLGRSESWIGFMTQYYKETAKCQVWPIVQAMDCSAEEFAQVMRYAGQGGADGILGYSFNAMKPDLWPGFRAFHRLPNLVANGGKEGVNSYSLLVNRRGELEPGGALRITNQQITNNISEATASQGIGISPGYGEWAEWAVPLPSCEPGSEYQFRGEFYQRVWENGAYPMVSMWDNEYLLNTHWKSKVFQPLRVYTTCPTKVRDETFRFINCNPKKTIWLRRPELKRFYRFNPIPQVPLKNGFFDEGFFPIGVYGANLENLDQIKRLAINTVVLRGKGKELRYAVQKCHEIGLRYVLSVPHDPDRLPVFLNEISAYVRPYDLAFYVNDEPGIHSFPTSKALDVNRLIKERYPESTTCMAVVRPQVCREYESGADFFMLDQYPVPFMPMTWLSDSMDECAGEQIRGQWSVVSGRKSTEDRWQRSEIGGRKGVNSYSLLVNRGEEKGSGIDSRITNQQITNNTAKGRLASVIQAFGGRSRLDHPRLPTWQEMDCLAFLSVIHGSRGVFFFSYSWIGRTEQGRERLGRVVGRLNRVYPWLVEENLEQEIHVEMLSENRFDPKGRPAVHCCLKRKGNDLMVIAVNTMGTYVEARLGVDVNGYSLLVNRGKEGINGNEKKGPRTDSRITNQQITNNSAKRMAREVFSGEDYPLVEGKIRVKFGPYETKAFLFSEEGG